MNFTYQKSVHIQSDIDTVWSAITSPRFEHDFLPEVRRANQSHAGPAELIDGKKARWANHSDVKIELTRKDLNVEIHAVEIDLNPRRSDVTVILTVRYNKRIERNFVKAHMAARSLFAHKLRVLKDDLDLTAQDFVFQ